jgi:hypothetical protein
MHDYSILAYRNQKPTTIQEVLGSIAMETTLTIPASSAISNIGQITVGLSELKLPSAFNHDITLEHRGKKVTLFEAYNSPTTTTQDEAYMAKGQGWGESPFKGNGDVLTNKCTTVCEVMRPCGSG